MLLRGASGRTGCYCGTPRQGCAWWRAPHGGRLFARGGLCGVLNSGALTSAASGGELHPPLPRRSKPSCGARRARCWPGCNRSLSTLSASARSAAWSQSALRGQARWRASWRCPSRAKRCAAPGLRRAAAAACGLVLLHACANAGPTHGNPCCRLEMKLTLRRRMTATRKQRSSVGGAELGTAAWVQSSC